MDAILGWLQHFLGVISGSGVEGVIATIASLGVIDVIMRLIKTQKPVDVLRIISKFFVGLSAVLVKLAQLIDRIVPPRLG